MQHAICTHCHKPISRPDASSTLYRLWEHDTPTPGLKPVACYKVETATPRRGSITKD